MQRRTRSTAAADAAARAEALRHNFISCLILTAQNGFGRDVEPFLALSRETWGEEILFDAVKDLPHGALQKMDADGNRMYERNARGELVIDAVIGLIPVMDPFGQQRTRLMYAAQAGDVARVVWLLARGARMELKDSEGRTALHWAALKGRVGMVWELLARGAAVDAAMNDGSTPLFIASQAGHLEVVRELLARGAAVNAAANGGCTPLYVASARGFLEVVQELLARGAAVDAAWSFATPLYIASQNGHLAIVRELLVRGAAVDTALNAGYTPLLIASQEGHLEVVRVLLAHGAAPSVVSNDGSTPLSRAYGAIAQLLHAAVAGAAP